MASFLLLVFVTLYLHHFGQQKKTNPKQQCKPNTSFESVISDVKVLSETDYTGSSKNS